MRITYEKSYNQVDYEHFTKYGSLGLKDTQVFWEYEDLIRANKDKNREEILQIVKDYTPMSKAKLRYDFHENTLSFYAPNKYIFPKFYLIFKDGN